MLISPLSPGFLPCFAQSLLGCMLFPCACPNCIPWHLMTSLGRQQNCPEPSEVLLASGFSSQSQSPGAIWQADAQAALALEQSEKEQSHASAITGGLNTDVGENTSVWRAMGMSSRWLLLVAAESSAEGTLSPPVVIPSSCTGLNNE